MGVELTSTIFDADAAGAVKGGDQVQIIASAPSDSENAGETYTLTATIKANGRVEWDKGKCSKAELC